MRFVGAPVTSMRCAALLAATAIAAVASCGREPTAPTADAARWARALSVNTVFPTTLQRTNQASSVVAFDRVHLVLHRSNGTVALDTTVKFPAGADQITLSLSVKLAASAPASGEPMTLDLEYVKLSGVTVFSGGPVSVTAVPSVPGQPAPAPISVPVSYSGPGSKAASVRISPRTLAVFAGDPLTFTAEARDASGAVIPQTPIVFTSLDPTATVNTSGTGAAGTARGTARIVAQLLTGPTDQALLTITLRASAIVAAAGSGQSGITGAALLTAVAVHVTASDGVGVGGVAVTFAAANGGSVGTATVTTDGNGDARTTWTLG